MHPHSASQMSKVTRIQLFWEWRLIYFPIHANITKLASHISLTHFIDFTLILYHIHCSHVTSSCSTNLFEWQRPVPCKRCQLKQLLSTTSRLSRSPAWCENRHSWRQWCPGTAQHLKENAEDQNEQMMNAINKNQAWHNERGNKRYFLFPGLDVWMIHFFLASWDEFFNTIPVRQAAGFSERFLEVFMQKFHAGEQNTKKKHDNKTSQKRVWTRIDMIWYH